MTSTNVNNIQRFYDVQLHIAEEYAELLEEHLPRYYGPTVAKRLQHNDYKPSLSKVQKVRKGIVNDSVIFYELVEVAKEYKESSQRLKNQPVTN